MLRAGEAVLNDGIIELHIPYWWCLLQPIDAFDQSADISLAAVDGIAFWLAHVDFLFKSDVEKRRLPI